MHGKFKQPLQQDQGNHHINKILELGNRVLSVVLLICSFEDKFIQKIMLVIL